MVRVAISVEGTTEEIFVLKTLAPHFLKRRIFIQPINMHGNVSLDRVKSEIHKLVYNFDYVTTLYDFYGFKKVDINETKLSLEAKILNSLKEGIRYKCIPYIQMYEFEALLFSSPQVVGDVMGEVSYVQWVEQVLNEFNGNPEKINNSQQTAPSKRFEKNTHYHKTIHGPDIAFQTGLTVIRRVCEGFDDWVSRIEALGN